MRVNTLPSALVRLLLKTLKEEHHPMPHCWFGLMLFFEK